MVLNSNPNLEILYKDCANAIFNEINKLRQIKRPIIFALPGGRSITGIYNIFKDADFDWSDVHFFLIDERIVPIEDPDSNYHLIMESFGQVLIQKQKTSSKNFHPFMVDLGIQEYRQEIAKFGKINIILLGAGEDGHCAALFPNHHSIRDNSYSYISMDDSPKDPKRRITASRNMILQADVAFSLFIGQAKRDALTRFLNNNVKIEECPIKIVNNLKTHFEYTDLPWKI